LQGIHPSCGKKSFPGSLDQIVGEFKVCSFHETGYQVSFAHRGISKVSANVFSVMVF